MSFNIKSNLMKTIVIVGVVGVSFWYGTSFNDAVQTIRVDRVYASFAAAVQDSHKAGNIIQVSSALQETLRVSKPIHIEPILVMSNGTVIGSISLRCAKEKLILSDYLDWKMYKSELCPNTKVRGPITMRCPRCGTSRSVVGHDKRGTCKKCGLMMYRLGNSLTISGTVK